uniref:HMG box domain-containing protein n=1 Tax=Ciona intestinalis TaxID=7719 RepID=F7AM14_CIOIN
MSILPVAVRPACLLYTSKVCSHPVSFYSIQNRPKRPLTSFFLFLGEKRKQPQYAGLRVYEVTKVAAEEWKQMDENEKQPYVDEMKASFSTFHERYQEYLNQLSDLEIHDLKIDRMTKREEKEKKREKQMKLRLGEPKRARSAYTFFMINKLKSVPLKDKSDFSAAVQKCAHEWNALSLESKEVFQAMADKDKVRHHNEMQEFIARVKEEDKIYLLPKVEQTKLRRKERLRASKESLERMLSSTVDKMRKWDIQEEEETIPKNV